MTYAMTGFGDAAYDQAMARNAALTAQAAQDASYQRALQIYAQTKATIDADYAAANRIYEAAYAAWQAKNKQYQSAVAHRNAVSMSMSSATASVVRSTGVNPPAGYTGCLNANDKASYEARCNDAKSAASVVVRGVDGLGWARVTGFPSFFGVGLGSTLPPECAWSELPSCVPLPSVPPNPGPAPKRPVKAAYPPAPVKPPPIAIPPAPGPPPASQPAVPQKAIAVGGILAAVLVGGGALYYLSTRKKKAA